jgi:hypothetical protein
MKYLDIYKWVIVFIMCSLPLFILVNEYMSESLINQITIDYLINKDLYAKCVNKQVVHENNRKDKRFYRKRISSLIKELLLGESPENVTPDVKYAFDNFAKTCIKYFKTIDITDIIQEDYTSIIENENLAKLDNILGATDALNQDDANKLMMRSINMHALTMADFVTKTHITQLDKIVLPKERNLNLMDPLLKKKGIKSKNEKKKNINNKYEETNQNAQTAQNAQNIQK